jgi:ATP-dependent Clp protease, protease subunit
VAKRFVKEDIDRYFDNGLDSGKRVISFFEDVEEYSAEVFIIGLKVLDRTPGDITVDLHTFGGDWYAGMAMHDAIAAAENPITIVTACAMSMGGIILQAADTRVLTPNATVMVHYGSDWAGGHVKDMKRRADENERTGALMEDIFLARIREKHSGYTREQFKQKFTYDVYMSAQEAIDFGLADEILA